MPIVLNSVDPRREDHPPFYVSLLVDNLLLHNCMLDSGASSNVITRKGNGIDKPKDHTTLPQCLCHGCKRS